MNKFERKTLSDLIRLYNQAQYLKIKIDCHYNEFDRLKEEIIKIENEIESMQIEKHNIDLMIEYRFYEFLRKNQQEVITPPPIYTSLCNLTKKCSNS